MKGGPLNTYLLLEVPLDLDHVLLGDPLRDGHHERNLRLNRVNNRRRAERRRHVNDAGVGLELPHGLFHGVEHGLAQVHGPTLLGGHATHDLSPEVIDGLLRVEGALLSREALDDDARVLVDPDLGRGAHAAGHRMHREDRGRDTGGGQKRAPRAEAGAGTADSRSHPGERGSEERRGDGTDERCVCGVGGKAG